MAATLERAIARRAEPESSSPPGESPLTSRHCLALALIGLCVSAALPWRADSGSGDLPKPVVILGVDGMDPDILKEVTQRYPERTPNFRWLIAQADGIKPLATSTPPQSPVAWSNFITGMDPGGHGIFDFIHRDPVHRRPAPSTTRVEGGFTVHLPGPYKIDIGADSPSNRSGKAFWTILREHGIPADIWRIPANFPVEPSEGVSFSGMMTPALDSAYGECSFYTSDAMRKVELDYEKCELLSEYEGTIIASLHGPANPFLERVGEQEPHEQVAFRIYVDRQNEAVILCAGMEDTAEKLVLRPGEWSDFLRMDFELLPLGLMSMSGTCRFYLRSISPHLELYASAVNFDPEEPAVPVSEPENASADLAAEIGRYYTQGMAEDVNALKNGVLDDGEFMQQVTLVHRETMDCLDYALDRYVRRGKRGLLFFYFSEIDLCSHMMWRHGDEAHPGHDASLAEADSSSWTGREGSKLADTVRDMYLRIDPALGRVRERLGDDVTLIVMSDHGFAPYHREFSLNTWLFDNGYLVLKEGLDKELPRDAAEHRPVYLFAGAVDWSRTRAYGMGFNGLYLNLEGREQDDPDTPENEAGIVAAGDQAKALLREIEAKLEALIDPETGEHPVLRCDLASEVYSGPRAPEAPDMLVGYDSGYGNSDASATGRIPNELLVDNAPSSHGGKLGTFNGNHLMHPDVVPGTLLSNRPLRSGSFALEDLTVEILRRYGIEKPEAMKGTPVLE
jgi:predicted AlkP superfamily phosphohydrolase/phosphomutase